MTKYVCVGHSCVYQWFAVPGFSHISQCNLTCISIKVFDPCMQAIAPFCLIQKGAHAGSIVAMHAQEMGSLVATAGCDHTVRVYDASTGECIVVHCVMDDVTALALHPVAPLLLVGMHSSLCLFEVLLCDSWPLISGTIAQSKTQQYDTTTSTSYTSAGISSRMLTSLGTQRHIH